MNINILCSQAPPLVTVVAIVSMALGGCDAQHGSLAAGSSGDPPVTLQECGSGGTGTGYAAIEVVSGTPAGGVIGQTVPALVARLKCREYPAEFLSANIKDADLTWMVLQGSGTLNGSGTVAHSTTDDGGRAEVSWTLGPVVGEQKVEVRFGSVSKQYTATATAPGPCDPAAGGTDHGPITRIISATTWTAADSPHRGGMVVLSSGAILTIEPGSVVCVDAIDSGSPYEGYFVAVGTAAAPIRFVDTRLMSAARRLEHVQSTNAIQVGRWGSAQPVTRIADSTFTITKSLDPLECPQVALGGDDGSAMVRSHINGYGSASCAAVQMAALSAQTVRLEARIVQSAGDAVRAGGTGTFVFNNCEITKSAGHGIFVFYPSVSPPAQPPASVSVNGCNLFDNGGDAIHSEAPITIDATNNWWGDPTGALGGLADGVSGLMNVGGFLPAPALLGY